MELNTERLTLALAPRSVRYFSQVASTNDLAKTWLLEDAPHGAAVIADEQTHGRGRHGRTWHTPPNVALAVSVALRVQTPAMLPLVNMAGALAAYDLVRVLQIADAEIKWANDVLIGGKKVCGILPEPVWSGEQLVGVVLGMGVNVRNTFTDAQLAARATTLEAVAARSLDRASLLTVLLFHLDARLVQLTHGTLLDDYKGALRILGQPVTVQPLDSGASFTGVAQDVAADGALILRAEDGTMQRVLAGDVSLVKGA